MKRKYNAQTKCYKIDIFVNNVYYCSTAQHKTCKSAADSVKKALQNKSKHLPHYIENPETATVKANFDKH